MHRLWSSHVVPFAAFGFEHWPLAGSHVPATWHWSLAVHVTGFPPVHVPLWKASVFVHALWSSHVVPSVAFASTHAPEASQLATLHGSLEVQGPVPVQTPA